MEDTMRKKSSLFFTLGLIALLSFTFQVQAVVSAGDTMTVKGDIIDNMCADGNKDNLTEFVKSHTKGCALMPNCVASGYSLYVDGKLHKFDDASNKKIEEFLKIFHPQSFPYGQRCIGFQGTDHLPGKDAITGAQSLHIYMVQ